MKFDPSNPPRFTPAEQQQKRPNGLNDPREDCPGGCDHPELHEPEESS